MKFQSGFESTLFPGKISSLLLFVNISKHMTHDLPSKAFSLREHAYLKHLKTSYQI